MLGKNSLVYQVITNLPHPHRAKVPHITAAAAPLNPHSLLFMLAALLSTGVAVIALAVFIATKLLNPGGYPDPFVPYQSIINLPGQRVAAMSELPCQVAALPSHLHQSWCNYVTDSEHFRDVEIVSEQGAITQVWFAVKSLQVVDLVQRWGPPQGIQQSRHQYVAFWDSGMVAYCALGRRFHNQLEVRTLLFRQSI